MLVYDRSTAPISQRAMRPWCSPAAAGAAHSKTWRRFAGASCGLFGLWPVHDRRGFFMVTLQKAIVFRQAFVLRDRADLDLVRAPTHGQIGQPIVLGFATARTDRHPPTGLASQVISFQRFGDRADLVDLEQKTVGRFQLDGLPDARGVGAEEVVPNRQSLTRERPAQFRPEGPILL